MTGTIGMASRWPLTRLKYRVSLAAGGTPSVDRTEYWGEDAEIPWVTIGDMTRAFQVTTTERALTKAGLATLKCRLAPPGTVLFAMYASVGKVARLGVSAVWNQAIIGMTPRKAECDGSFLAYWLEALQPFVVGLTRSNTQDNLNAEQVGNLPFPAISASAQRSIADFLDRETARTNQLIDRRKSLVGLLWSRWESAVYRTVTNGLDAEAQLVGSGLDWAGEIPAHWTTPPVYANFDVQLGKMLNPERASGPSPAPYLRNVNVQWDRLDLNDLATMSFDEADRVKYGLSPGDLLVCEGGEVGRSAIWRGDLDECYFQKALHRVRPHGNSNARFLMYCLWAAASMKLFNVEGNQATIVHLTAEQLRAHRFPMPPRAEQNAIVEHLDHRQSALRRCIERIERQIDRLREHRQALITAAVTGQTALSGDVREQSAGGMNWDSG